MGKGVAALAALLLGASATGSASGAGSDDTRLAETAYEARQVLAVIEWSYVRNRACPQPSRATELSTFQDRLGDGYSVGPHGAFLEIRGISMAESWRYYASPLHPETCTLWRELGEDRVLIFRWQRGIGHWAFNPGDGRPERPLKPAR